MEAIFILLALLAIASSRNLATTNYMPTKEQLELIFGDSPSYTKPLTEIDNPAKDLIIELFLNKDSNVKRKPEDYVAKPVELNISAHCDNGIVINETVKVHKNLNSTDNADSSKQVDTGRGNVKVNSRFDDRVALGGDACPSGQVRLGNMCVAPA